MGRDSKPRSVLLIVVLSDWFVLMEGLYLAGAFVSVLVSGEKVNLDMSISSEGVSDKRGSGLKPSPGRSGPSEMD